MTEEMDKLCRDAANVIDADVIGSAEKLSKIVWKLTEGDEKDRAVAMMQLGVLKESMVRECPKARRIMNELREGRLVEDDTPEIGAMCIDLEVPEAIEDLVDDFIRRAKYIPVRKVGRPKKNLNTEEVKKAVKKRGRKPKVKKG